MSSARCPFSKWWRMYANVIVNCEKKTAKKHSWHPKVVGKYSTDFPESGRPLPKIRRIDVPSILSPGHRNIGEIPKPSDISGSLRHGDFPFSMLIPSNHTTTPLWPKPRETDASAWSDFWKEKKRCNLQRLWKTIMLCHNHLRNFPKQLEKPTTSPKNLLLVNL